MEYGYRFRLYLLTALVLMGIGALLTRLHEFQIERRAEFQSLVPGNRKVYVREPGVRGEITDRNGIVLARNVRKYEITFNLEEIRDSYLAQHANDPVITRQTVRDGMRREIEERDIVSIVKDGGASTIGKLKKLGLAANFNARDMRTHFVTHGGLVPYSYRSDLDFEDFAVLAEHNQELPGVYLNLRPERLYPYGALASHILGYTKQWEKGNIPADAKRKFDHYIGEEHGVDGIEASMNHILRGPEGTKTIIKNDKGRTIATDDIVPPDNGATVQLTIDARKQFLLENILRRVGRAAGVIMDVNTGEVLAMASVPDYNPNAFIPSISSERWNGYMVNKKLSPFTNRAITPFVPGSPTKLATAISGELVGKARSVYSCRGYVTYGTYQPKCWIYRQSRGMHGPLNISKAIKVSCNTYFYQLSNAIGGQAMVDGFSKLGFGETTRLELPLEKPGILPGSRSWRARNPNVGFNSAAIAQMSIGQGNMMATPIQLCAMTACIANGGKYYRPRLVRKAVSCTDEVLVADKPELKIDFIEAGIKTDDFELIRKGMWMAVNETGGTAGKAKMPNVEVAAKTGTAQTTDFGERLNNALMVSFAPYENPKYAICVVVQGADIHRGSGGSICGPLVHLLYRGLFSEDEGFKLPLRPQQEFAGNTDTLQATELPKDITAVISGEDVEPTLPTYTRNRNEHVESGDEAIDTTDSSDTTLPPAAQPEDDTVLPTPTLTPEIDAEGTVVPRATPVQDNQ